MTFDRKRKFEYKRDLNTTPLPKDILDTLRDNALKYTRKRKTLYDK